MSTPTSPPPAAFPPRASRGRRWRTLVLGTGLMATSAGSALAYSQGAGAPPPPAASPRDLRAQVESLLDASQGTPRDEQLRRLGSQAVPVLSSLVMDGSAPSTRRARAVASLALVDPTRSAHSIQEVLEDARAPADVRASAAGALARCLGIDAIPSLSARLTDQEEPVREAVALALGRLGGQQVRQALEDRLPLEERPLVREALQRGLSLAEP